MSTSDKIAAELFRDKSLLAVYRHSAFYAENRLDRWVKIVSGAMLVCLAIYIAWSRADLYPAAVKSISSWTTMGFDYSITILGFLVAGFTIFSTMTKVEIFIALTLATHKTENVSYIKFIFYNFLRVFINHIALLAICVAITMMRDTSPIYLKLLALDDASIFHVKRAIVVVLFPLLGYVVINAILQLKTFVWNLYQSIILAIAGAVTLHEINQSKE